MTLNFGRHPKQLPKPEKPAAVLPRPEGERGFSGDYLIDAEKLRSGPEWKLRTDGPQTKLMFGELDRWAAENPGFSPQEAAKKCHELMTKFLPAENHEYQKALEKPEFTKFMSELGAALKTMDKAKLKQLNLELKRNPELKTEVESLMKIKGENIHGITDIEKVASSVCRHRAAAMAAMLTRLGIEACPAQGTVAGGQMHLWVVLPKEKLIVEATMLQGSDVAFNPTKIEGRSIEVLDGAVTYNLEFVGEVKAVARQTFSQRMEHKGAEYLRLLNQAQRQAPDRSAEFLEKLALPKRPAEQELVGAKKPDGAS